MEPNPSCSSQPDPLLVPIGASPATITTPLNNMEPHHEQSRDPGTPWMTSALSSTNLAPPAANTPGTMEQAIAGMNLSNTNTVIGNNGASAANLLNPNGMMSITPSTAALAPTTPTTQYAAPMATPINYPNPYGIAQFRAYAENSFRELSPREQIILLDTKGISTVGDSNTLSDRFARFEIRKHFGVGHTQWNLERDQATRPLTTLGHLQNEADQSWRSSIPDQVLRSGQTMGPYRDPISMGPTMMEESFNLTHSSPTQHRVTFRQPLTNDTSTPPFPQAPLGTPLAPNPAPQVLDDGPNRPNAQSTYLIDPAVAAFDPLFTPSATPQNTTTHPSHISAPSHHGISQMSYTATPAAASRTAPTAHPNPTTQATYTSIPAHPNLMAQSTYISPAAPPNPPTQSTYLSPAAPPQLLTQATYATASAPPNNFLTQTTPVPMATFHPIHPTYDSPLVQLHETHIPSPQNPRLGTTSIYPTYPHHASGATLGCTLPAGIMTRDYRATNVFKRDGVSFSGSPEEDPYLFLGRMEDSCRTHGLTEEEGLRALSSVFKGRAYAWFNLERERFRSLQEFLHAFKLVFCPPGRQEGMAQDICHRTQGPTESLRDYLICMRGLFSNLHPPPFLSAQLDQVHAQLHPNYARSISRKSFSTYEELMALGHETERTIYNIQRYRPPPTPEESFSPYYAYPGLPSQSGPGGHKKIAIHNHALGAQPHRAINVPPAQFAVNPFAPPPLPAAPVPNFPPMTYAEVTQTTRTNPTQAIPGLMDTKFTPPPPGYFPGNSSPFQGQCFRCGQMGHMARFYPSRATGFVAPPPPMNNAQEISQATYYPPPQNNIYQPPPQAQSQFQQNSFQTLPPQNDPYHPSPQTQSHVQQNSFHSPPPQNDFYYPPPQAQLHSQQTSFQMQYSDPTYPQNSFTQAGN